MVVEGSWWFSAVGWSVATLAGMEEDVEDDSGDCYVGLEVHGRVTRGFFKG